MYNLSIRGNILVATFLKFFYRFFIYTVNINCLINFRYFSLIIVLHFFGLVAFFRPLGQEQNMTPAFVYDPSQNMPTLKCI